MYRILAALLVFLFVALPVAVRAQESAPQPDPTITPQPSTVHSVELRTGYSNLAADAGLAWRVSGPRRWTFIADLRAGTVNYDTIGGYAFEEGTVMRGRAGMLLDTVQTGPLTLGVYTGLVGGRLQSTEALPDTEAALAGVELGTLAQLRLAGSGTMELGFIVPVEFELTPAFTTHRVGQITTMGAHWAISDRLRLGGQVHAGGLFGSDGDGQKADYGGTMTLRFYPTGGARQDQPGRPDAESGRPRVGAYVGTDWRMLGLAGHVSHGPGVQAGLLLANGHLKVGVVAFGRPGPMNPATFDLNLADDQTYNGQSTLALRSDGAFVGVGIAPIFSLGSRLPISIEIPIAVGQSAFGYYLVGDDRNTPDGRRPSEWENDLQDERDASFAIGLDVGVDIAFHLRRSPWLQPYVGVRRHQVFGYDAFLENDYSGFAGVAGLQLGSF